MKPPTYRKQVQHFIGAINDYRNMWPRRSHTLAPVTRLTSNKQKFKWTQFKQDTFKKIKWILAHDTF